MRKLICYILYLREGLNWVPLKIPMCLLQSYPISVSLLALYQQDSKMCIFCSRRRQIARKLSFNYEESAIYILLLNSYVQNFSF